MDERRSQAKASLLLSHESDSDESMADAPQLPHAPPSAYDDASVPTFDRAALQSEASTVHYTGAGGDGYESNTTVEWDFGPACAAACAVATSAALSAAFHAKRCAAVVEYAPLTAWTNKAPRQSSTSAPLSLAVSGSVPLVLGNHHPIVAPGIASTAPPVPVAFSQGLNSHSVSVLPAAASVAPSVSDADVLEPGSHFVTVSPGVVSAAPSVPAPLLVPVASVPQGTVSKPTETAAAIFARRALLATGAVDDVPSCTASMSPSVPDAHPQRGYDTQLSHDTLGDDGCTDFDRAFILRFLPSCYNEHADYGGVLHVCSACERYFSKAAGVSHPAHYGATARGELSLVSRHMFHTTQCAECYDPERPTGPAEHDQLRYVNFREHIVLPDLGDYLLHNDGTFLAYLADLSPGIRAAARLQSEQLLNRNALRLAKIQKEAAFCVAEEIRRQSRRKRFKLTSPPSEASPSVASPLWGQSDSFWRCDVCTLLNLRGAGTCTTCGSIESQSSASRLCGNSSCLRGPSVHAELPGHT